MPSLFFPNLDAFRLALASGIVPAEVVRTPLAAAAGPGGCWVRSDAPLSKDSLAALAHIGVRPFAAPAELEWRDFACWAEALPLKLHAGEPADHPAIFEVPNRRLARFLRELARCGTAVEAYRVEGETSFVRVPSAPHYWALPDRDDDIRSYRRAESDFWVESGWQHPFPGRPDPDKPSTILVSAAAGWRTLAHGPWLAARELFPLRPQRAVPPDVGVLAGIGVPIRLKRSSGPLVRESFWIIPGEIGSLGAFAAAIDPRELNNLELAPFQHPVLGSMLALRDAHNRGVSSVWPEAGRAFAPHPRANRLMVPVDRELTPPIRGAALEAAFCLRVGEFVWLEQDGDAPRAHRMALSAFRPLSAWIRYSIPASRFHRASSVAASPFAWAGFVVAPAPAAAAISTPLAHRETAASAGSQGESARSWFAKWAAKLFAKSSPTHPQDPTDSTLRTVEVPFRTAKTLEERLARRAELEERLFDRDTGENPGRLWAELAELYSETGNPVDAALGWMHALWDTAHPPETWATQWAKLESRQPQSAVRATLVELIRTSSAAAGIDLKAASENLESLEDSLPCRLVWLARLALAGQSGGDVLQLAHGRDRLFARLHGDTALAALDTPSFLRFRGAAGGDRYAMARDWLLRCREPIQRWLKKQAAHNRANWSGVDIDSARTAAYADGMLAWGFAKLGGVSQANELSNAANRALANEPGSPCTLGVQRELSSRFRVEIQLALGMAAPAVERAQHSGASRTELGTYAVAKLLSHSQILGGSQTASEFGGRPLAALIGDDDLGRELTRLLACRTPTTAAIRAILDVVAADGTAVTLPRATLTLLEIDAPRELLREILAFAPRALELLPEALRIRAIQDSETAAYMTRTAGRCVEVVARICVRQGWPGPLRELFRSLCRALDDGDPPTRAILRRTAPVLFRALARSGASDELRQFLARWYRIGGDDAELNLSAAIGWYTLGETERGNRMLNDAREQLFVRGVPGDRERGRASLAYCRALAHAPPRLALGRLEELFQRLGPIASPGATSQYFDLPALEMIDTAITAIVNEDFSLGPELRRWLDEDELRIRRRITRDLDAAMAAMPD